MEKLWRFVFEKLYCQKTGLIYENITEYTGDGNICNLPTPEQINLQVPNPCSWGTGMEDSMINAGIMLDTVLSRYAATEDPAMKEYADKQIFVAGGGTIYEQLLPQCETAYVTKIYNTYPADTVFPNLDDHPDWELAQKGEMQEENGVKFSFDIYKRK